MRVRFHMRPLPSKPVEKTSESARSACKSDAPCDETHRPKLVGVARNARHWRRYAFCSGTGELTAEDASPGLVGARDIGVEGTTRPSSTIVKETNMLRWALIFFIVALVAAFFGFGGIAGTAAGIAEILFYGFIIVAAIALVLGLMTGKKVR